MVIRCFVGFDCLPDGKKRFIWAVMVSWRVCGPVGRCLGVLAGGARGWLLASCVVASRWASIRLIAGNTVRVRCLLIYASVSKAKC